MKVILLEDIVGIGKKFEVKNIPDGYARNHLLPKKKIKIADLGNLKKLEIHQLALKKHKTEEQGQIQDMAKKLDKLVLKLSVKIGEKGSLFESITKQKIADLLNQQGIPINKSQIELTHPIKTLGNFSITIKPTSDIKSQIQLHVKAAH